MKKTKVLPARYDETTYKLVVELAAEKDWTESKTVYEIVKSFFSSDKKVRNVA